MKKIFILLSIISLIGCAQKQSESTVSKTTVLITDISVIDVSNGTISEKQQIVIDSGKIKTITPTIEYLEKYAHIIQGQGKYIIPGLAEMHAHIPPSSTSAERIEEVLYLSNGITTIKGMLGQPSHLTLRENAINK